MNRGVTGDPMCFSSIGLVEKHQEHTRELKQERGGRERTYGELATTSSHTAVFLIDLGEIPNWGAVGDDWRWGLVHWVHNYLAELSGEAIYRFHRRWWLILEKICDGRRKGWSLAQGYRGTSPWQNHRRWPDMLGWVTATKYCVLARGTRAAGGQLQRGYLDWPWGKWVRAAKAEQCLKLILSAQFFTEDRYPRSTGRESQRRRESGREIIDGDGGWTCDLIQSLYHGDHHQSVWQSKFQGPDLKFFCDNLFILLWQSCWSTIQLWSCYSNHT
jgi:hypothetical protein